MGARMRLEDTVSMASERLGNGFDGALVAMCACVCVCWTSGVMRSVLLMGIVRREFLSCTCGERKSGFCLHVIT